jgi:hypothetical protein
MKRKVYIVLSHYDTEGHKSRSVDEVKAEIVTHKGYEFAVYRNRNNYDNDIKRKWIVLDLNSGKIMANGKTKKDALSKAFGPVFSKYEDITKLDTYKQLCEEYKALIAAHEEAIAYASRGNS